MNKMQRFPQHLPVVDKSAGLGAVGCHSMGVFPLLSSQCSLGMSLQAN